MIDKTEEEIMKHWEGDISTPVASICSRTYNHEKYIADALDSFLMQETNFPFEIVLDEDCSSDKTSNIIRKYLEKFPNILKANLRNKNVGLRVNFLENIQRAKGEYIALCDGDDYWNDPLHLHKQVYFLKENNDYILAYSSMKIVFEEGMLTRNVLCGEGDREAIELQKHLFGSGSCTVCFRNIEIIDDYPFEYHCSPSNDHFLYSILGEYGKGKFLPDIEAVSYRQHDGGDYAAKTVKERNILHQQTDYALYMYYLRIGNQYLSEYFYKNVMHYSFAERGIFYYLKLVFERSIQQGKKQLIRIKHKVMSLIKK